MTCIVAVSQGGKVYMASERAGNDPDSEITMPLKNPKIWTVGSYVM